MAKTKIIGKQWLNGELDNIEQQMEKCKAQFNMLEGAKQTLVQQLAHLDSVGNGSDDGDGPTDPDIDTDPGDEPDGEEEQEPADPS